MKGMAYSMNNTSEGSLNCLKVLGTALVVLLAGCTTYVERPAPPTVYYPEPTPPPQVYTPPPAPAYVPPPVTPPPAPSDLVEVRTERDFDEPLSPYGRWVIIEPYGRCWIPSRVDPDWRPYSNGSWRRTPAGWYWHSDEPWGWATYHYGRWDFNPGFGWYWVPQTQWAPAWVEWRQGAGYVGWAPLHPSARFSDNGFIERNEHPAPSRHFVFVEERQFLAPVRPATTVVNNTTIINNTVNISNIKVVNNTVINEGPRTTIIEQASGQKVQTVPVHELRRVQEAPVVAVQRPRPRERDNTARIPVTSENQNRDLAARLEAERRAKEAQAQSQARPDTQNAAKEQQLKAAQLESERRANQAKLQAQQEAQRIAKERDARAAQLDAERRASTVNAQAQQEAQRIAKEREMKAAQLEAERRANEAKAKTAQDAQRIPGGPVPDPAMVVRVRKALSLNPGYRQVSVLVSKGVLQLNGFVTTEAEKKQAAEMVKSVAGVKVLQNNLATKE